MPAINQLSVLHTVNDAKVDVMGRIGFLNPRRLEILVVKSRRPCRASERLAFYSMQSVIIYLQ